MVTKAYIYSIKNKENGKCYIGSTNNPRVRWSKHKGDLARSTHHSFVLQRAWNKYGKDNFEFKVLLECAEKDKIEYENRCMVLQSYNVLKTANATAVYTEEVRKKFRNAKLGIKYSRESVEKTARSKWKPVVCTELGISFLSQKHAAEYLGIANSTITEALKRKGKVKNQYTLIRVI